MGTPPQLSLIVKDGDQASLKNALLPFNQTDFTRLTYVNTSERKTGMKLYPYLSARFAYNWNNN